MTSLRRVLMVAYFFPPLGGGGVQRTLKHTTYLPAFGWEPVVITARNPDYEIRDERLLEQVPASLEVHRSYIWEPTRLYRVGARLWARRSRRPRPGGRLGARSILSTLAVRHVMPRRGGNPDPQSRGAVAVVRREVGIWANLSRYFVFPDYQIAWLPFAVLSAVRVHRRRRVDAVYSSAPPITAHLVAGVVKSVTGLPWVADFRDPWIGNAFALPLPAPHRWLQRRIEHWIVTHADRVVLATPGLTRMYRERYPDVAHRFVTITNGYDRAELPLRPVRTAWSRPLRLVYSGSLYGESELAIFLAGLDRLLEARPGARDEITIEFVGWLSARNRELAEAFSARPERSGLIRLAGFVSHQEALRHLQEADAALHLLSDGPAKDLFVAGKLFEYVGLNLPLFAMLPDGDASAILRDLGWGIVVRPDPDDVAAGLAGLLDARPSSGVADPEGRYDRRRLAESLASHLGRRDA